MRDQDEVALQIALEKIRRERERRASSRPIVQRAPVDPGMAGADPLGAGSTPIAGDTALPKLGRGAVAGLEVALQTAGNALTQPFIGLYGAGESAARLMPGGKSPMDAANTIETASNAVNNFLGPRTQTGKNLSAVVAKPFALYDKWADWVGEKLSFGSPLAATAIKTTLVGAPMAIGVKGRGAMRRGVTSEVEAIEARARDLGVEFGPELRTQVGEAARDTTSVTRGSAMGPVHERLVALRDQAKADVDAKYKDARTRYAEITPLALELLNADIRTIISEGAFDIDSMPILQKRMGEISSLANEGASRAVLLSEIEQIRRRINANKPAATDLSQAKALNQVKREMDEWMDFSFNNDMIRGDASAVQAWREARDAHSSYSQRFTNNKVIRQLVSEGATPETMRRWVFGATRAGFQSEAGSVIKRLKDLLGENSPEFTAIRQEALFDVVEPLLGEKPDFNAFNYRYDRVVRDNPTIWNELAVDSKTPLTFLRQITGAAEKTGAAPVINFDLDRAISQALVGHDIARRGLAVRTATLIMRKLRGTGRFERRAMMREMLGYDPNVPLMNKNSVAYGSVVLSEIEQGQPEEE